MKKFDDIYGTLYAGGIAAICFYIVFSDWKYNIGTVIIFGPIGLMFAAYSIGIFLDSRGKDGK
jgi:hypothetical protein